MPIDSYLTFVHDYARIPRELLLILIKKLLLFIQGTTHLSKKFHLYRLSRLEMNMKLVIKFIDTDIHAHSLDRGRRADHVAGAGGWYGFNRYSEKEFTAAAPRTSLSRRGNLVTWKSSYKSAICSKYFS